MIRLFVLATVAALIAPAGSPGPLVSTDWLSDQLRDPLVRVIATGDRGLFDRGHIPGARFVDHMETLGSGHHLLPPQALATVLARAGASDGAHVILYGDSPMTTGWLFLAFASIGHASDVSMLDGGIDLWRAEGRPVSTTDDRSTRSAPPAPPARSPSPEASGLSVRPAPDVAVDAEWVRSHLDSPAVRLLDVRTADEWNAGHLPGATLVLWPDLFADRRTLQFKSPDEMRALFTRAGVQPGQQVVTYCAVGMRASLMYWAAMAVGLPARVYVGSFEDWRRDSTNPIVR